MDNFRNKNKKILPHEIVEIINSVDVDEHIKAICEKYRLREDQTSEVYSEIGMVLHGETNLENFAINLRKRLGIIENDVNQLANDIDNEIFQSVHDSLKIISSENSESQKRIQDGDSNQTFSSTPAVKPQIMDFPIEPARSFPPEPQKQEPRPATGFFSEQNRNEFEPKPKPIERIYSAPKPPTSIAEPSSSSASIRSSNPRPTPARQSHSGGEQSFGQARPSASLVVPPPVNLPTEPPARTAPPEFVRQNNNSFQNAFKPTSVREYGHSENLDRESILKDIENPNDIPMSPRTFSNSTETAKPTPTVQTKAVEYDIPDTELPSGKPEASLPIPNIPKPQTFTPKPPSPPPIKTFPTEPQSIIEKKLQQTISIPRKKSTYTIDPYREPLG